MIKLSLSLFARLRVEVPAVGRRVAYGGIFLDARPNPSSVPTAVR